MSWGNVTRAERSLDWEPGRTWVFAVGLLEWEREDLWAPFPAAMIDRRDEQLVDYFRDAGVDEDRINYLQDSDATKSDVEEAFVGMLEETEEALVGRVGGTLRR